MSNIKGEIKEEKDRRQQMQDSVNDFVSDFYEKFGFKPIVAFEDINSIKLKGLCVTFTCTLVTSLTLHYIK